MPDPRTLDEMFGSLQKDAKGRPGVHVPEHGDCLFVYLDDAPYERVYVDPFLSVYEALDDGRLVGFQLKGLKALEGEGFRGIDFKLNPPIIALLFASYRLHADGVEDGGTLARVYSRVASATARTLDLQSA